MNLPGADANGMLTLEAGRTAVTLLPGDELTPGRSQPAPERFQSLRKLEQELPELSDLKANANRHRHGDR